MEIAEDLLATFKEGERRIHGERTKAGMARRREMGVQFGKPSPLPLETLQMIRLLRRQGLGARRILRYLNDNQVPTPSGSGKYWFLTQVQRVLTREAL